MQTKNESYGIYRHTQTHRWALAWRFHFPQSWFVAAPPQLSTAAAFKSEMLLDVEIQYASAAGQAIASWQIVYTRSSMFCTRCIACWYVHSLTSTGISVYVAACVCVCMMSGCMCVSVFFVMLFMRSICSRFDSRVSSGRQRSRTFFSYLRAPNSAGVQALITHKAHTFTLSYALFLSPSCLSQSRR